MGGLKEIEIDVRIIVASNEKLLDVSRKNSMQKGSWAMAGAHTMAHLVGALAMTALGFKLGRILLS